MNAKFAEISAEMGSNVGIVLSGLRCDEDYVASGLVWASKKAQWRQSRTHSALRSCLRSGLPHGLPRALK